MENAGKLLTPLPPNYVTLASLKKRQEERLKQQEEEERRREKEAEEEEEKEEEEKERKLKEEEEEDEMRFKKGFGRRRRKPALESPEEEEERSEIKTNEWREKKKKERKKRWKQKKAERKIQSELDKTASERSTVEEEKQPVNPTVVAVEESKETKRDVSDRNREVIFGRRRRWEEKRGVRKEWRKKEESSSTSSSTKYLTNPVAEIAPSVGGRSVVSESNDEKKISGSPAGNWGTWRRGRRFGNRVREDGFRTMWVKKEQVTR